MPRTLLFLLAILCATSCAKYDNFGLDEVVTLKAGEAARFVSPDKEKTLVTFSSIPEDSRCPKYTNCIWEGQATVAFQLGKNPVDSLQLNLRAGKGQTHSEGFFGHRLRLIEVNPYPEDGIKLKQEDYSITFIVETVNRP